MAALDLGELNEKNGFYVVALDNIAPQAAADMFTIKLMKGDEEIDTIENYSIKKYAKTILEGDYSYELKVLVTEMLTYCETAQKYTKHNMDNLATAGLENLLCYSDANREDFEDERSATQNAEKIDGYGITGVGVKFDSANYIYAKFEAESLENVTVTINGKTAEIVDLGNMYAVYTDAILATGFGDYYTIILNVNGEAYQTITYSVNSFAKNNNDLGDALYKYGVAANAYIDSLNA